MATIQHNITSIRGDTIFSPTWFILLEDLPPRITASEIEAGIADGTYTPVDLTAYEITGQVRATPQGTVVINLPLVVTDGYKLSFNIPAETTAAFTNENQSYGYDIQFKTIADGTVKTWIAGKLQITTDYTYIN
ncbi:hypothetical protein [Vibrio alginolyticus]|uniref:hypothetical protein n=1 Tax=Vibrio alginolyticus TaxID=663 RepID=UPI001BD1DCB1|nr:hypothetical protein [Vibrio alginolyticus]MBS9935781.1 hypothetical protein [Vibrio alginolyticus]